MTNTRLPGLTLVTAPSSYPVTRTEARERARIEDETSDAQLDIMIAAATNLAGQYLGRSLMQQTWKLTLDEFTDAIQLPMGPVQSVTHVKYYDTAGSLQTVASTDYTVDTASDPQWVVLDSDATWPSTLDAVNVIEITYVAGYTALPDAIKFAILVLVEHFNEGLGGLPPAAHALLANDRSYAF